MTRFSIIFSPKVTDNLWFDYSILVIIRHHVSQLKIKHKNTCSSHEHTSVHVLEVTGIRISDLLLHINDQYCFTLWMLHDHANGVSVHSCTFLLFCLPGFVQEKTLFHSNSLMPHLRRRINDDLSSFPPPYRILQHMLKAPGALSGYTFYTQFAADGGSNSSLIS